MLGLLIACGSDATGPGSHGLFDGGSTEDTTVGDAPNDTDPADASHRSDADADPPVEGGTEPTRDASAERCEPMDAGASDTAECPDIVDAFPTTGVCANGWTFRVRMAGPETGEPVVLLHGFPESSYEWSAQLRSLSTAGYRVIAPDQRGYSPGARPMAPEAYKLQELVADVLAIADAVGARRFHLVGHDWGGAVGWYLAQIAPERVISLTSVSTPNSGAFQAKLADEKSCQYAASSYFEMFTDPNFPSALLALNGAGLSFLFSELPADSRCVYFHNMNDEAALKAALNWYVANVAGRRIVGEVGRITVPTLLMWGDQDPYFCRDTVELSGDYVDAPYRLEIIAGGGHWLPEGSSDRVSLLLLEHLAANRTQRQ
ncbi:MAG: alpha/beta hydrolase [Myxococcales bacterium]